MLGKNNFLVFMGGKCQNWYISNKSVYQVDLSTAENAFVIMEKKMWLLC